MLIQSISSVILRAFSLVGKFILVVYLARNLAPDDLGRFSLIVSAISLCVLAIGLDFYAFNTREIVSADKETRYRLISNQFVMHLLTYVLSIPLLSLFFFSGSIEWRYASWFCVILVLEHLAQELYRILIVLAEPVWANIALFLRSGAWVFVLLATYQYTLSEVNLGAVFAAWTGGGVLSLVVSVAVARRHLGKAKLNASLDWQWILSGVRQSGVFFAATIFMKSMEYGERFLLQYFRGDSDVGIYSFYASIAIAIQAFVIAGVISILYPKILRAYESGDIQQYRKYLSSLAVRSLGLAIALGIAAMLLLDPVLDYVGQAVFREYSFVLAILVLSSFFVIASFVPHYALYARRSDKSLLWASMAAFVVVLAGSVVLVPKYGIVATAAVNLAGAVTLFGSKSLLVLWPDKGHGSSRTQRSAN